MLHFKSTFTTDLTDCVRRQVAKSGGQDADTSQMGLIPANTQMQTSLSVNPGGEQVRFHWALTSDVWHDMSSLLAGSLLRRTIWAFHISYTVIAALLHPKCLVSFPRIPFPETIKLRIRSFPARKNSCRTWSQVSQSSMATRAQGDCGLMETGRSQGERYLPKLLKYSLIELAPGAAARWARRVHHQRDDHPLRDDLRRGAVRRREPRGAPVPAAAQGHAQHSHLPAQGRTRRPAHQGVCWPKVQVRQA